jgi:hypothetical protein
VHVIEAVVRDQLVPPFRLRQIPDCVVDLPSKNVVAKMMFGSLGS